MAASTRRELLKAAAVLAGAAAIGCQPDSAAMVTPTLTLAPGAGGTATPAGPRSDGVLFDDDFSAGLQGWSGLLTTGENYYPSLSPVSATGPFSMVLETSGGVRDIHATASKRLYAFPGRVRWWTRFAWNAGRRSDLRYVRFVVDWQQGRRDRRWFEVRYTHWNESAGSVLARWDLTNAPALGYTEIPGLSGYELGYNMVDKYDFHDIIIEIDAGANRYVSVQVDQTAIDLTGLGSPSSLTPEGDFANGSNFLFYCHNLATRSESNPKLFVDRTRAEVR